MSLETNEAPLSSKCCSGCLFFTVLSPGGTFATWLRTIGVSTASISLATSGAQICGFLGTGAAPLLIGRLGLYRGAAVAQLMQVLPLLVCAATLFVAPAPAGLAVATIVATLSLSRVGLWGFDLCERQIVQTAAGQARAVRDWLWRRRWLRRL